MAQRKPAKDPGEAARRIRAVVEAKENMAWPCRIVTLATMFGLHQLTPKRCEEMTALLQSEGVRCVPSPLPNNPNRSALLFVEDSVFAAGWHT